MFHTVIKARRVLGTNIMFREVTIGDAEFILSLRLNEKNRKWLSKTPTLVEDQIDYIKNYKLSIPDSAPQP